MSDFEYAERVAGVYPAVFIRVEDYPIKDKDTDEVKPMWRWVFHDIDDDTPAGEMDTISTPGYRPRSNGLRIFTGMLGRDPGPGDDPLKLAGATFDVVYGQNQGGRLTITDVHKPKQAKG